MAWFGLLLLLVGTNAPAFRAQQAPETASPRVRAVGVIAGPELNSASSSDTGDNGLSRLAGTIGELGGSVVIIPANREIPADVELVLLIRPQRALTIAQTAHLWDFLRRGGHLLLAIDPIGHNGGSPESARASGIDRLLQAEYGLNLVDNLLVEDWFGVATLGDVETSWSEFPPSELFPHAVTEPLIRYDVPLRYWGGRSILVDGLTGVAATQPLIATERPYGETARVNFGSGDDAQLTRNIGPDTQGRLLVGGLATSLSTGSRVAVIGDGEIFLNGFGQARRGDRDSVPLYPGDSIFAQRLLAWLMAVPESEVPGLPSGVTWIAVDGDGADWPTDASITSATSITDSPFALAQARAFQNDQYVYLLLEPQTALPDSTAVSLFVEDAGGNFQFITATPRGPVQLSGASLDDADVAMKDALEIRLPRRLFATAASEIARVCVGDVSGTAIACLEEPIRPSATNDLDPLPVRPGASPQAFARFRDTKIRSGPGLNNPIVVAVPAGTPVAVVGRNSAADWLRVRTGRYEGWMSVTVVAVNADVQRLPDLEG